MPATSEKQATAARIAMGIKKGKVKAEPGTPSAEMAKMSKKELKKFTHTKKNEGALEQVYAVQKPYSGCQLTSLVHPIDPLVGLGGSNVVPDQVHSVYPTKDMADQAAGTIYEEYQKSVRALEEKKALVVDKIKKGITKLETARKKRLDLIKENPKGADEHRDEIAKIANQIDDLVGKLKKIEDSKKELEKKEEEEDKKEDIKEALKRFLNEENKSEFFYKKSEGAEEKIDGAKNIKDAKAKAYKKYGDDALEKDKVIEKKSEEPEEKEEPKKEK